MHRSGIPELVKGGGGCSCCIAPVSFPVNLLPSFTV